MSDVRAVSKSDWPKVSDRPGDSMVVMVLGFFGWMIALLSIVATIVAVQHISSDAEYGISKEGWVSIGTTLIIGGVGLGVGLLLVATARLVLNSNRAVELLTTMNQELG